MWVDSALCEDETLTLVWAKQSSAVVCFENNMGKCNPGLARGRCWYLWLALGQHHGLELLRTFLH